MADTNNTTNCIHISLRYLKDRSTVISLNISAINLNPLNSPPLRLECLCPRRYQCHRWRRLNPHPLGKKHITGTKKILVPSKKSSTKILYTTMRFPRRFRGKGYCRPKPSLDFVSGKLVEALYCWKLSTVQLEGHAWISYFRSDRASPLSLAKIFI